MCIRDRLHLTVFDGERERCILSGIAKWYKPEDLLGKKAVSYTHLDVYKRQGLSPAR